MTPIFPRPKGLHKPGRLAALVGGVAIVAAGAGFGVARLTPARPAATPTQTPDARSDAPRQLEIKPEAVQAADIGLVTLAEGGFETEIASQATVTAAPGGEAVLTSRVAGSVTRILKRLGDPIRAGETLAVVESRDAAQIAADRSVAASRAVLARKTLERERRLYDQRVSPRQDLERAQAEAAAAGAEARRAQVAAGAARVTPDGRGVVVTSPIGGRIMAAPAHLGAFVQPETELFRIADPAQVQIEAPVAAAAAQRIAPGDRAVVQLADGRELAGKVRSVTPGLNPETAAATAVIDVAGASALTPGLFVKVRITPAHAAASTAIVVPEEAVQSAGGRTVVFVRTAAGFAPTPVTVRQRGGGRAEIVAGLKPGQVIAARNAFLLKAELEKGEGEED